LFRNALDNSEPQPGSSITPGASLIHAVEAVENVR